MVAWLRSLVGPQFLRVAFDGANLNCNSIPIPMKTCSNCKQQYPADCTLCPECGCTPQHRIASPEDLLSRVSDRRSFIEFLSALAEERKEAEGLVTAMPGYETGDSQDWQNSSISSFLSGALAYFDGQPNQHSGSMPNWRMFAEILYYGKIYE